MTRPLTPDHLTPARLTPTELLRRGVGWVDDYRHILGIQLKARLHPDPPPAFAEGDGVPILVLPGIYEPWHSLERIARDLNRRGHPIIVVPELGLNVAELRASARTVAQALRATGSGHLIVLAHSKGGLIGKALMLGPLRKRILGLVAIATPFGGSKHARWFPDPTVRMLSDQAPHLESLHARAEVNARIYSVYASFDPHIPGGCELAGAHNIEVDVVGHFRLVEHPRVRRAAIESVNALLTTP
mgnify:FL=1